ncbi:hypothetical protein ALC53_04805 [Atta colombica]|uniref:Uncharacterized protein n=1 Tax=Atta colombica TaxID=520822 RepID=A0A195BJZ4_9HYME|nr:hypothetical protein ALC53_04805 [Atta colombica]
MVSRPYQKIESRGWRGSYDLINNRDSAPLDLRASRLADDLTLREEREKKSTAEEERDREMKSCRCFLTGWRRTEEAGSPTACRTQFTIYIVFYSLSGRGIQLLQRAASVYNCLLCTRSCDCRVLLTTKLKSSKGIDIFKLQMTIAEGLKVREKEGSSQLLGVVCRANSQQIMESHINIFRFDNVRSSRYNKSEVNSKFISDEHIKPMSVNQNVRTSIPTDYASDKSATSSVLVLANTAMRADGEAGFVKTTPYIPSLRFGLQLPRRRQPFLPPQQRLWQFTDPHLGQEAIFRPKAAGETMFVATEGTGSSSTNCFDKSRRQYVVKTPGFGRKEGRKEGIRGDLCKKKERERLKKRTTRRTLEV